jgi:hypothetical protein
MKNLYVLLLLKLLLFATFFVAIDNLIGKGFNILRERAFEKNELAHEFSWKYCIEKAEPDVAIFGSSTGSHHYIPKQMEDSLGMTVYNFANDGCFFLYQNIIINLMLDRYSPKVIVWEIGESCLSSIYDTHFEYQNMNLLYPYYNEPYVKKIVNEQDCFQPLRMMSCSYRENSKILSYMRLCVIDNNSTGKGYLPLEQKGFANINQTDMSKYITVQRKVDLLEETIKRCKEYGVKLVLTSSPRYYDNSVKDTDPYIVLMKIANSYNVPFVDFYNSEPFNSDSTLFKDNSHMNHVGTELYMSLFIPELKKLLSMN